MGDLRTRWLAFYAGHIEPASKEIFAHVEKMIIGTLIVSAGAHVSSNEPAIVLFGYLRHGLVGRGVELFGVILLVLNFLDGLYKLAKAELACRVPDRDDALLYRAVGPVDPVDPRISRRVAGGLRGSAGRRQPCRFIARELGQHVLACGRNRGGLRRQALHDAAAAGRDAAAQRANVGAACRPQHEQFLARPHRPQHQRRRGRGGRRRRRGSRSPCAPPAAGARRRRWRH